VLVTGGAGFLGSHLCERLLADGSVVVCVDNFFTSARCNVEHLLEHKHFCTETARLEAARPAQRRAGQDHGIF
jgi:nucleoside-diphosphate-sugar epimerase